MKKKVFLVWFVLCFVSFIARGDFYPLYCSNIGPGPHGLDLLTITVNLPAVGTPVAAPNGNYSYAIEAANGVLIYMTVSSGTISYMSNATVALSMEYNDEASNAGLYLLQAAQIGGPSALPAWFDNPISVYIHSWGDPPLTQNAQNYSASATLFFGVGPDPNAFKSWDDKALCAGMPQYNINRLQAALTIADNPVGYSPPFGAPMKFIVTYNQYDDQQGLLNCSNFGPNWGCNWLSYVTDDPVNTGTTAYVYVRGGGIETYSGTTYNSTTHYYGIDVQSCAQLQWTGTASYVRYLPDGSEEIFSHSDGATTYPRHLFMTQVIDAQGNTSTINLDSSNRIVTVVDPLSQTSKFSYEDAFDPLKITRITDPFGRSAQFGYDYELRLNQITDAQLMSSQLSYSGSTDFINSMTTPYGSTMFSNAPVGQSQRALLVTDPLGGQEMVLYQNGAIADSDPSGTVPSGVVNSGLSVANSFYWSKKAMMTGSNNFADAEVTHWLYNAAGTTVMGVPASQKESLENRVWYLYPGQTSMSTTIVGTLATPSQTMRVLDSGSTQDFQYSYNSLGHVTGYTDPMNRTTNFTYASNQIDLTQVGQIDGSGTDVLLSATYNSIHRPTKITDASGEPTNLSYNTVGELQTLTDPLTEQTTLNYINGGYLQSIVGAITSASNSFTYDYAGRVQTTTQPTIPGDTAGYTLTYAYDNLDRVTTVGYPDGTTTEINYNKLDVGSIVDRLQRTTSYTYDPLRHLTLITDPANRTTQFNWCMCGALNWMKDGNGNETSWVQDVEGRTTSKTFADTSEITYKYENTTSRLNSITDAKSQMTNYTYYNDNNLAGISYTGTNGLALSPPTPSVSYSYDTVYNRVTGMSDGSGSTTRNYNPITGTPTLGAGHLENIVGPLANSTIAFGYDALGRVNSRTINGGSNSVTVSYDAIGRTGTATNPLGTFIYTPIGGTNLISSIALANSGTASFSYYNNLGDHRLQEITNSNPSATVISQFNYTYDAMSRILQWAGDNPSLSGTETYNFGYDGSDEVISARLSNAGGVLKIYGYAYDGAENRTSGQLNASITSIIPDNINEFTSGTGGGPMTFQGTLQDPASVWINGNPAIFSSSLNFSGTASVATGSNTVTISATDPFNQSTTQQYAVTVPSASGTYSYDKNGNLINDGVMTYQWDAANRLIVVGEPGNLSSQFTYDGLGRRVSDAELNNGVVTSTNNFIWCGTEMCEERSASDSVIKRYYSQGVQVTGSNYYYTRDHLGSVRELANASGTTIARFDYDPYGQQTELYGSMGSDFGYAGQYFHQPSGLNLELFRAYSPSEGRWINRDPIGENGGVNMYGYVENDPINLVDPIGLEAVLTYANGSVYTANSAQDFLTAINAAGPGSIVFIDIYGHAAQDFQGFDRDNEKDSQGLQDTSSGDIYLQNSDGVPLSGETIAELLNGKLFLPGASIHLHGCRAAATDDQGMNITRDLSGKLSGADVIGSSIGVSKDGFNIPLDILNLFTTLQYRNGTFTGGALPWSK